MRGFADLMFGVEDRGYAYAEPKPSFGKRRLAEVLTENG
jgi:hypothetical protein